MISVLLAGQKWFGAEVFRRLRELRDVAIVAVSSPRSEPDRLTSLADLYGVPVIPSGMLRAEAVPPGVDLIVAAHSHDFIGEKTRLRARYGGIGYHPSLLPLHRGRDAVRWAVRMREPVTGGTVYRLTNRVDGGEVLAQSHVFIHRDDTAETLWRRDLGPLGIRLLAETVARFALEGYLVGTPQDESLATWEPSYDRPPMHRPELPLLPSPENCGWDDELVDIVASAGRGIYRAQSASFTAHRKSSSRDCTDSASIISGRSLP